MKTISYESLRAEHAWQIIAGQLDRRNRVLVCGIRALTNDPTQTPTVGRLMQLRHHLHQGLNVVTSETRQRPVSRHPDDLTQRQWMHIRQLAFLLTQIDNELAATRRHDRAFQTWLRSLADEPRLTSRLPQN